MNQKDEILRVLSDGEKLTQSKIAEEVYGDSSHKTAIYARLQKMVNEGVLEKSGSPARYSIVNNQVKPNIVSNAVIPAMPKEQTKIELSFDECEIYNRKWVISNLIYNATKDTLFPLVPGIDFYVIYQPFNHNPAKLPENKMAFYFFHTQDECLKVGQVSAGSGDRYQRQHYHVFRNRGNSSTLAKSILEDDDFADLNLNDQNIGNWIKTHCERYDVIINVPVENGVADKRQQKIILNMIEGLLQTYFSPKYEG